VNKTNWRKANFMVTEKPTKKKLSFSHGHQRAARKPGTKKKKTERNEGSKPYRDL